MILPWSLSFSRLPLLFARPLSNSRSSIITTVGEYCLCQCVKKQEYEQALKTHHAVMQAAMKCKHQMDVSFVDALDHAIADMAKMYTK